MSVPLGNSDKPEVESYDTIDQVKAKVQDKETSRLTNNVLASNWKMGVPCQIIISLKSLTSSCTW